MKTITILTIFLSLLSMQLCLRSMNQFLKPDNGSVGVAPNSNNQPQLTNANDSKNTNTNGTYIDIGLTGDKSKTESPKDGAKNQNGAKQDSGKGSKQEPHLSIEQSTNITNVDTKKASVKIEKGDGANNQGNDGKKPKPNGNANATATPNKQGGEPNAQQIKSPNGTPPQTTGNVGKQQTTGNTTGNTGGNPTKPQTNGNVTNDNTNPQANGNGTNPQANGNGITPQANGEKQDNPNGKTPKKGKKNNKGLEKDVARKIFKDNDLFYLVNKSKVDELMVSKGNPAEFQEKMTGLIKKSKAQKM